MLNFYRVLDMLLAIVKFNGGRGALLCNGCHTILDTGFNHQDQEHFCEHCATGRRRVYTRPGVRLKCTAEMPSAA